MKHQGSNSLRGPPRSGPYGGAARGPGPAASGRVTSHDVARLAGVSQSAVSRAFSPGASVSPKTLEKIKRVAESLNYRPNVIARSLITGRSRVIGLVVAYLGNSFYSEALENLSQVLQKKGYHVLIFMAYNTDEELDRVVHDLLDHQVDGIIAASVSLSNSLSERCGAAGIPLVLFNRHQGEHGPTAVTSDNYDGAKQVARFMARAGCRKIAHIAGWSESSTGCEREAGFRDGLAELGIELKGCIDGAWNRRIAAEAARSLFSDPGDRPDGVFVGNDHMAFAVMDVLRYELGLRIPEDVSVVGFDDAPQAAWKSYDLTTFRQPIGAMVDLAVEALLERIDNNALEKRHFAIPGRLVVRNSAKSPGSPANE
ncbi:MAG: LacI family DNA-binding transcriptional regulator [Albidovulum sp.]|nr:LacI family DNA-binding transcriptional regulator [Albidovulum sp.]